MLKSDDILKAYNEGATRTRRLVYILMFVSLASLLAYLNSLPPAQNWFRSRSDNMHYLYHWVVFPSEKDKKDTAHVITLCHRDTIERIAFVNRMSIREFKDILRDVGILKTSEAGVIDSLLPDSAYYPNLRFRFPLHYINEAQEVNLDEIPVAEMRAVIGAARNKRFSDRKELEQLITIYNRVTIENSLMADMPFIDTDYDVNSNTSFSGLVFAACYLLLIFTIARERSNLRALFIWRDSTGMRPAELYQLLTMDQILTVPPSIANSLPEDPDKVVEPSKGQHLLWILALQVLATLPKLVPVGLWVLLYLNDAASRAEGMATNAPLTEQAMSMSLGIGAFLALVFMIFLYQEIRLIGEWHRIAKNIRAKGK